MTEVGLLPFARVALEVATAILDRYRTPFSKHQFMQPQLLAVLCLMRYEDWGASAIDCWWDQHNPINSIVLLAEMAIAVLKCGQYRISHFVCWR